MNGHIERSRKASWLFPLIVGVLALGLGFGAGFLVFGADEGSPNSSAAASKEPVTEESSTPTQEEGQVLALGDEQDLTAVKATAYKYKRSIKDSDGSGADKGMRWDEALVRLCNVNITDADAKETVTSYSVWQLVDSESGVYQELDLTPSPATSPQWETFRKLAPGACMKGWVAFDLAKDAEPVAITYSVADEEKARWALH